MAPNVQANDAKVIPADTTNYFYDIIGPDITCHEKLQITFMVYKINWKNMDDSIDCEKTVLAALDRLVQNTCVTGTLHDRIAVKIEHSVLESPINLKYIRQKDFTSQKILDGIAHYARQWKKELDFDTELIITLLRLSDCKFVS